MDVSDSDTKIKGLESSLLNSSKEFVVLTEIVRKRYVSYLERQLEENVHMWAKHSRNHHKPTALASIGQSLEILEDGAIKSCMAAQIYQRAMIATVRRSTKECRLAQVLFDTMQRHQTVYDAPSESETQVRCVANKSTQTSFPHSNQIDEQPLHKQTDDSRNFTLQEKIDLFQSTYIGCNHSYAVHPKQNSFEETKETTGVSPIHVTEDAIAKELAQIFGDESTDFNEIFGIDRTGGSDDPKICDILKEIENAKLPDKEHSKSPVQTTITNPKKDEFDLKQSLWPCELYHQRCRLNACVVRMLEDDWRYEDVLREKCHLLFGEDSEDEFSTFISSPSIDLADEVLLASCILRIRPWIVQQLMRPLQDSLIANRFLFKKLAKTLANIIVIINPYPMKHQVKEAVEYLFSVKASGIQCAQDLEDLPTLPLNRPEY